jgi:hypothetical protein
MNAEVRNCGVIACRFPTSCCSPGRLFEFVTRKSCIVFLDEFDALARTRTDAAEHNELRHVVNSLLLMIGRARFCDRGNQLACDDASMTYSHLIFPRNVRSNSC